MCLVAGGNNHILVGIPATWGELVPLRGLTSHLAAAATFRGELFPVRQRASRWVHTPFGHCPHDRPQRQYMSARRSPAAFELTTQVPSRRRSAPWTGR